MAWDYDIPDDVPVDDDGVPRHPEKGYPICGYPKTDAVDKNGRKREDVDACLLSAGWGTDRSTGACRNHFGASPGGPKGWANGNARHLLYSEQMREEDREVFEAVVKAPDGDGDLMSVEDMADMLKTSIGWEFTRLQRAIDQIPESELVEKYACPRCGNTYTASESSPLPDRCTGFDMSEGYPQACEATRGEFSATGERFVAFNDKAVERKEAHLATLIKTYKQVADGVSINVDGTHEHTHKGDPDEPVEVAINHVAVDLPPDEDPVDESGDED